MSDLARSSSFSNSQSSKHHPYCSLNDGRNSRPEYPAKVPGTVLTNMLENGFFKGVNNENVYFHMNLATLPDISDRGVNYYSAVYRTNLSIPVTSPNRVGLTDGGNTDDHIPTRDTVVSRLQQLIDTPEIILEAMQLDENETEGELNPTKDEATQALLAYLIQEVHSQEGVDYPSFDFSEALTEEVEEEYLRLGSFVQDFLRSRSNSVSALFPQQRYMLALDGINYEAVASISGEELPIIPDSDGYLPCDSSLLFAGIASGRAKSCTRMRGMHGRYLLDATAAIQSKSSQSTGNITVPLLIETFPVPEPDTPGGQGGLFKSMGKYSTAQYTAGWDWIQATPDRNSGIWGKVKLKTGGRCLLRNTWLDQSLDPNTNQPSHIVRTNVRNLGNTAMTFQVSFDVFAKTNRYAATPDKQYVDYRQILQKDIERVLGAAQDMGMPSGLSPEAIEYLEAFPSGSIFVTLQPGEEKEIEIPKATGEWNKLERWRPWTLEGYPALYSLEARCSAQYMDARGVDTLHMALEQMSDWSGSDAVVSHDSTDVFAAKSDSVRATRFRLEDNGMRPVVSSKMRSLVRRLSPLTQRLVQTKTALSPADIPTPQELDPALDWFTRRMIISLLSRGDPVIILESQEVIRVGLRTVTVSFVPMEQQRAVLNTSFDTFYNTTPIFAIDSTKLFLRGGNWIATDQLLRDYNPDFVPRPGRLPSKDTHVAEILLQRQSGLNLLRVWGGTVGAPDDLLDAADEYGMLIEQDIPMTGDVNGRWGGSLDWPLDKPLFVAQIRDTARRQRSHPSLLARFGGNEISPLHASPSPVLRRALEYTFIPRDRLLNETIDVLGGLTTVDVFTTISDQPQNLIASKEVGFGFWDDLVDAVSDTWEKVKETVQKTVSDLQAWWNERWTNRSDTRDSLDSFREIRRIPGLESVVNIASRTTTEGLLQWLDSLTPVDTSRPYFQTTFADSTTLNETQSYFESHLICPVIHDVGQQQIPWCGDSSGEVYYRPRPLGLADGPYGPVVPAAFYNFTHILFGVGLTPEIGSVGIPPIDSMPLILAKESMTAPKPLENGMTVDPAWKFHNYLPHCTACDGNMTSNDPAFGPQVDHVYALLRGTDASEGYGQEPAPLEDFTCAAQIVAFEQHRAVVEAAMESAWTRHTGVLIWKVRGPWPHMRGAPYDHFLAPAGGLWGMAAAASQASNAYSRAPNLQSELAAAGLLNLHVQLDLNYRWVSARNNQDPSYYESLGAPWYLNVVNMGPQATKAPLRYRVLMHDLTPSDTQQDSGASITQTPIVFEGIIRAGIPANFGTLPLAERVPLDFPRSEHSRGHTGIDPRATVLVLVELWTANELKLHIPTQDNTDNSKSLSPLPFPPAVIPSQESEVLSRQKSLEAYLDPYAVNHFEKSTSKLLSRTEYFFTDPRRGPDAGHPSLAQLRSRRDLYVSLRAEPVTCEISTPSLLAPPRTSSSASPSTRTQLLEDWTWTVDIANPEGSGRIAFKVEMVLTQPTLHSTQHEDPRILPVYYSENMFSLPPGQSRRVAITAPLFTKRDSLSGHCATLIIRGWNINELQMALPCPSK